MGCCQKNEKQHGVISGQSISCRNHCIVVSIKNINFTILHIMHACKHYMRELFVDIYKTAFMQSPLVLRHCKTRCTTLGVIYTSKSLPLISKQKKVFGALYIRIVKSNVSSVDPSLRLFSSDAFLLRTFTYIRVLNTRQ